MVPAEGAATFEKPCAGATAIVTFVVEVIEAKVAHSVAPTITATIAIRAIRRFGRTTCAR